jgi:5-methylcytosine-specific restriction endonuclease McrA
MKTVFQSLHEKAVQIAKTYLKVESDLISILKEIDFSHGYREMGFKSLFEYANRGLGLSESVSYNFMTVARKAKEVPQLEELIQKKEITVSNARTIAPVLNVENQEKWLMAAASLSKRELEKEIAKEFPERQIQERARYVSEKRVELKFGISEELYEELKRVQDLVSTQAKEAADLEKTLRALIELYVEKKDPVEKAKRAEQRESRSNSRQPVPGQENPNPRFIPAKLEHAILLRGQGQCTQKRPDGVRCNEKRWLQIHHIQPLSQGGETTFENLRLVCQGHHRVLHYRVWRIS